MLVPQQYQQLCQRCGRLPAYPTALCPSCGTPLALPWPNQRFSGPYPSAPFPPDVLLSPPGYAPLMVELLLNCVGIYGVGWLMLGNSAGGMTLLVCSIVLWPLILLLSIFTLGLGLLCFGPLAIGAIVCNGVLLQKAITRTVG